MYVCILSRALREWRATGVSPWVKVFSGLPSNVQGAFYRRRPYLLLTTCYLLLATCY